MAAKRGAEAPKAGGLSRRGFLWGVLGAGAAGAVACAPQRAPGALELESAEDRYDAFLRMRCAGAQHPEAQAVWWWTGDVHAFRHGARGQRLFGMECFSVSRALPVEGGHDLLHREFGLYLDAESRAPLSRWRNPLNGREVEVLLLANDPVNGRMRRSGPRAFDVSFTQSGAEVWANLDILLRYPSPLPRAQYPLNSQSDTYEAAELFQFHARREDLANSGLPSAPCEVYWTRVGPWLPWMEMADRPGQLIYHCRGRKLPNVAALPAGLRRAAEDGYAQFLSAPESFEAPNETSWTKFKKWEDARRARAS